MDVKKVSLLLIGICLILVVYIVRFPGGRSKVESETVNNVSHPLIFYEQMSFFEGVKWADQNPPSKGRPFAVGIIPHHLFPSFILADFFKRLKQQNPETIILVGPNHPEKGGYKVLTSQLSWSSPFGEVLPNNQVINDLLSEKKVKVDEEVLTNEHSVAGMMPYIKYYLPEVKVVPIILSGTLTINETDNLANKLLKYWNEKVVLVAPVDFSHYLNSQQAQKNDKLTWEIMSRFDYKKLYELNNDYLDSPPSIGLALMVAQKLHKGNLELLFNTNSGLLQNNNSIETTSYFSIVTR